MKIIIIIIIILIIIPVIIIIVYFQNIYMHLPLITYNRETN